MFHVASKIVEKVKFRFMKWTLLCLIKLTVGSCSSVRLDRLKSCFYVDFLISETITTVVFHECFLVNSTILTCEKKM